MTRIVAIVTFALAFMAAGTALALEPVGTAFTYQGQLKQNGAPVTGDAEFIFKLWDAPTGGNQVGETVQTTATHPVVDGLFTIQLDFNPLGGWIFDGTAFWLEVQVEYPADSGSWETLTPRQRLTAAPFASFSTLATAVPWAGILDLPAGFADGVDDVGEELFWSLVGNAGTTSGTDFIGTTDDTPLELRVNGMRALRLEPTVSYPNVIAGHSTNHADPGVIAAAISGGAFNSVHAWHATVGGGIGNEAHGVNSTIAGGDYNMIGDVAGWATIAGGRDNEATQEYAMIPGGLENFAGGEYSFAAGRRAKVRGPGEVGGEDTNGDEGTFVWADSKESEFWSTGPNQFLIRANGGVGINTNAPEATLHLVSPRVGEQIDLYSPFGGTGIAVEATYPTEFGFPIYGGDFRVTGATSYGVYAQATNSLPGILGSSTYGVYGKATSVAGAGASAYGGYFVAAGATPGAGVYGQGATGVYGTTSVTGAGGGYGVRGVVACSKGKAVSGQATDTGYGPSYGGYFSSGGTDGIGVYGYATGSAGRGVIGDATGTYGIGVYGAGDTGVKAEGTGEAGYALWAEVTAGNGTAVYARSGASGGYAGHFVGNVKICSRESGATVIELGTGLDYAEGFDVTDAPSVAPGMVLVIDPRHPGQLALSTTAYDRKVAGIVAGANGLGSAVKLGCGQFDHDVALAGRVYCFAVAGDEPIEPGDLLTSSDVPGHAMKVQDHSRAQGAILGKAMERLEAGKHGQILVLVTLQ